MKFNFSKIIGLCLITPHFIISSPLAILARNPRNLHTLQLMARNKLNNHTHAMPVRHMATGVETLAVIAEVAPALAAALPCIAIVGGTCYTLAMFYEVFGRAPTPAEIELALLKEEAQKNKLLWEKALKQARKTGERAENIYERSLFVEAQKKIIESEKAMQGYENDLRELKLKERNQRHILEDKHLVFERNIPQETSPVVAQQRPQATARQQHHTGNTHPVPIPKDAGCKLPPAPAFEQPKGCGTTNPETLDSGCKIPLPEQPKATSVCEIPIVEPSKDQLILERSGAKCSEKPRMMNSPEDLAKAMKEIKKNYEWDNQENAWKLRDNGEAIRKGVVYISPDYLHGELEAFDKNGKHLGAINPQTKEFYKPAVENREL